MHSGQYRSRLWELVLSRSFPPPSTSAKSVTDCGNRLQRDTSRDGFADWLCRRSASAPTGSWFRVPFGSTTSFQVLRKFNTPAPSKPLCSAYPTDSSALLLNRPHHFRLLLKRRYRLADLVQRGEFSGSRCGPGVVSVFNGTFDSKANCPFSSYRSGSRSGRTNLLLLLSTTSIAALLQER